LTRTSKSARTGVWIAIIIIIAILAAYGGYYSGFEDGSKHAQQGPGVSPTRASNIKVGVIASNVSYASDVLDGIQLARDLLNNKSDVALRNVTLSIKYLDGEDPERMKYFVTSLINEGIRVVIGMLTNSEVKAILQSLRENDVTLVLVSNDVYDDVVYDDPKIVKILGGPDVEARVMADLALEIGKEGLNATIIVANNSYYLRLANIIREVYYSRGGRIVYEIVYEPEKTNVTEGLINVRTSSPAVIFFAGRESDAPTVLETARNVGLEATWILPSAVVDSLRSRPDLAPYLTGSYLVARRNATLSPGFESFAELYRVVYRKEPREMAAYGFDSLMLVALSSAYAGEYKGSAIKGAMDALCKFVGITWPKFLDPKGNIVQEYDVLKVVDGGCKVVGRWVPTDVGKAYIEWLHGS
jgi:ABC-type branched-subunit amino acid transport system substrate-binding protein